MDTEETDPVVILGEFCLEDSHDHLKDLEKDLQYSLEKLMNVASNNEIGILPSATPRIIESEQCHFIRSLIKTISKLDMRAEPINNTTDLYKQTIQELEDEVRKMEVLETTVSQEMSDVKKEIIYLENEGHGLQRMKEACMGAIEDVANSTYHTEIALATRLFAQVKKDLGQLVTTTTVSNEDFQEVLAVSMIEALANLTSSYMKGGNEVYINVDPGSVDCVHFLIEADVAMYHPNDKNKVRLTDLI